MFQSIQRLGISFVVFSMQAPLRRFALAVAWMAAYAATAAPVAAVAAAAAAEGEPARVLLAGAAAVDVTPQHFPVIVNGGVGERTADRVVDRLFARALVLDDGSTAIAIAIVDVCMVPQWLTDRAKQLAHEKTGLPVERMLIAATHTHSAPSVHEALGSDRDERYSAFLPGKIAEAIAAAHARRVPARIGWGVGRDEKNVYCRRWLMQPGTALTNRFSDKRDDRAMMNPGYGNPNRIAPTGPVDPDVTVLAVTSRDGRPLAVLANYSTHYAGAPAISADYFGVFARRIRELVGGDEHFVGMMSNGTSGDANCLDFSKDAPRAFTYETVGEDTAQAAWAAYRQIEFRDWAPIAMVQRPLALMARMPTKEEVAAAREFMQTFAGRKPATWEEVYARETVLLAEMPAERVLQLQAIRIGALGIAAIPAEVYGSSGLRIKEQSPLRPTFTITHANGAEGYVPPPEQHALGGYTTWRRRTSCLPVDAEPKIVSTLLEALRELAARPDPPPPSGANEQ